MTLATDLEIRHLQALRTVAEERSFGRAADRLGFTQSAVSQQIAAQERIVGEELFHRPGGPKPVELTPVGRLLLEHAQVILDRLSQVEEDLTGFRNGTTGRLLVGTYQSMSVKVLPSVIGTLKASRPQVEVRPFESDDNELLLSLLLQGELDLTFAVPSGREGIEIIELIEDPYVLISPLQDHLGGASVAIETLHGIPMVGCQNYDFCQLQIEAGLRTAGVTPRFVFRSSDNAAVQAMVRAGAGHAVMPLLAVDITDREVLIRRITPALSPRIVAVAIVANRALSPIATEFIEVARQAVEKIEGQHLAILP